MSIPSSESTSGGVSLVRVASLFVRRRRMIASVVAAVVLVTVLVTLLRSRTYTANASFTLSAPQSNQLTSDIAVQLGINLGGSGDVQSPQFYADLVKSRVVLAAVAESTYVIPTDSGESRMSLIRAYAHADDSPQRARDRAVDKLRKRISADVTTATGVVSIAATERSPDLAAKIARVVVQRVNDFNLRERQLQAGDEREFTEKRMDDALGELHSAENALAAFYAENRDYNQSPRLTLESERLQRVVNTKQQVYTSLVQAYERARISELRDTPVIVPIENPEAPSQPDPRGLIRNVVLAIVVSLVLVTAFIVVVEYYRAIRTSGNGEFDELAAAWRRKRD